MSNEIWMRMGCVCHVYQTATGRKVIPDNTPHQPYFSVWNVKGVGGGGRHWTEGGRGSDFKGWRDTYQQMSTHQTQEERTDERRTNAPPASLPSTHPLWATIWSCVLPFYRQISLLCVMLLRRNHVGSWETSDSIALPPYLTLSATTESQ